MRHFLKLEYFFILLSISEVNVQSLIVFNNKQFRKIRAASKLKGTRDFSWVDRLTHDEALDYLLNPLTKTLRRIGLFLAAHKYFEVDRRYTFTSSQYEDPVFFKHFPIPRLKERHNDVVSACDRGFLPCVEEIFKKANISGSLAKIHNNLGNNSLPYHPFTDSKELFRYRVTASYYMCWYTELREEPLALPDKFPCFDGLEKTEEANGNKIVDFRSDISTKTTDTEMFSVFTCAYLWFCPDPCYGKTSKGNVIKKADAVNDKKNPCKNLKDKSCFWDVGKNRNFEDLIRNKFNYSCNCEAETKGYVWSPMYSFCVDRDECYEGSYTCPNGKICRNTVGAYMCTCRRGYYLDQVTDTCQRHDLLSEGAANALNKRVKEKAIQKSSPTGVLYVLKLLVEIVQGHCTRPCVFKLLVVVCVLTLTCCL